MSQPQYEIVDADGAANLRLSGDWTTTALGRLPTELSRDLEGREIASIDTADLGRFDTAGALALVQASSGRLSKSQWKDRPEAGRIYHMIELLERESAPAPKRPSAFIRTFSKIGRGVYDFGGEAMLSLAFLGRLMAAVVEAAKHPGGIRWPAWVSQAERAGLDAIPIVMITNFFIGAVIAFIGVDLLTDFGAQVFAVQLIGVAMFREF
ncbi:MAG: ABC transporter permease, partial [Brevundimonas sp.]